MNTLTLTQMMLVTKLFEFWWHFSTIRMRCCRISGNVNWPNLSPTSILSSTSVTNIDVDISYVLSKALLFWTQAFTNSFRSNSATSRHFQTFLSRNVIQFRLKIMKNHNTRDNRVIRRQNDLSFFENTGFYWPTTIDSIFLWMFLVA